MFRAFGISCFRTFFCLSYSVVQMDEELGFRVTVVGCGYVDWIGLAQDRDRWRTLVSAVMNLRVP